MLNVTLYQPNTFHVVFFVQILTTSSIEINHSNGISKTQAASQNIIKQVI